MPYPPITINTAAMNNGSGLSIPPLPDLDPGTDDWQLIVMVFGGFGGTLLWNGVAALPAGWDGAGSVSNFNGGLLGLGMSTYFTGGNGNPITVPTPTLSRSDGRDFSVLAIAAGVDRPYTITTAAFGLTSYYEDVNAIAGTVTRDPIDATANPGLSPNAAIAAVSYVGIAAVNLGGAASIHANSPMADGDGFFNNVESSFPGDVQVQASFGHPSTFRPTIDPPLSWNGELVDGSSSMGIFWAFHYPWMITRTRSGGWGRRRFGGSGF